MSCSELVSCSLCDRQGQCGIDPMEHGMWLVAERLKRVRKKVLVMSNKGGVGKSTVAANLAAAMAASGLKVGLADADLSGPSVPHMFGLSGARIPFSAGGLGPLGAGHGLKVASLGFFLPDADTPVLWRDSFKFEFLTQLLGGFAWGELDVLVLDMPPGTGGELIGALDLMGGADGAVVVTTPQALALADVRRAAAALQDSAVPVLGIVENMAGLACPHCGGEIHPFKHGGGRALAETLGVPLLGAVPLDIAAMEAADAGRPVVWQQPASPAARVLAAVAEAVVERLGRKAGEALPLQNS